MKNLKITILTDNPDSWIIPYARSLFFALNEHHMVQHIYCHEEIEEGDVLILLSCERILKKEKLKKHKSNIVIHPSALPEGKGWSPLAWQVLAGRNIISITLFEAIEQVDSGDIYLQGEIRLRGDELNGEIKAKQGLETCRLVKEYISKYPMQGIPQGQGESFYRKRKQKDNQLDVDKTLAEQFNLLRIIDNERYPAWFHHKGCQYAVTIKKIK